ncbi:unnamed protein product [Ixodes pacificus]
MTEEDEDDDDAKKKKKSKSKKKGSKSKKKKSSKSKSKKKKSKSKKKKSSKSKTKKSSKKKSSKSKKKKSSKSKKKGDGDKKKKKSKSKSSKKKSSKSKKKGSKSKKKGSKSKEKKKGSKSKKSSKSKKKGKKGSKSKGKKGKKKKKGQEEGPEEVGGDDVKTQAATAGTTIAPSAAGTAAPPGFRYAPGTPGYPGFYSPALRGALRTGPGVPGMAPRYSPRFAPIPGGGVTARISVTSLPATGGVRRYRLMPGASPSTVSFGSQRGSSIVVAVKRRRRSSSLPSSSYSSMQMAQAPQYYTGSPYTTGYYDDMSESYYDDERYSLSSLDYEGSYYADELVGDQYKGDAYRRPADDGFTFPPQIHMQPPAQLAEPYSPTIQIVMQPPAEPFSQVPFTANPQLMTYPQMQTQFQQMQSVQESSKPIIIHHQSLLPPGQPPKPIIIHHQTPNMHVQISSTSNSTTSVDQAPPPTGAFRPHRAYSPPPPHYHDMVPPSPMHIHYSPPPPIQEYAMSPPSSMRRPRRFHSMPSPTMMTTSIMPSPATSMMMQPMIAQPPPPPMMMPNSMSPFPPPMAPSPSLSATMMPMMPPMMPPMMSPMMPQMMPSMTQPMIPPVMPPMMLPVVSPMMPPPMQYPGYPQPAVSNTEKIYYRVEKRGESSDSDYDYRKHRRRGQKSRKRRRRSWHRSSSPSDETSLNSLRSVSSAPATQTPVFQQYQQLAPYQAGAFQQPKMLTSHAVPQAPYITGIPDSSQDLMAIERAMKKMYIERFPSEPDRQSLFPERSLIIILVMVFIFAVLVVVIAVMRSSSPTYLRGDTEALPTIKTNPPSTELTTSALNSTVRLFARRRH